MASESFKYPLADGQQGYNHKKLNSVGHSNKQGNRFFSIASEKECSLDNTLF